MAVNKLVIGSDVYTTDDSTLLDGSCLLSNSISGEELTINTLNATVDASIIAPTLLRPSDHDGFVTSDEQILFVMPNIRIITKSPNTYTYGQRVEYYHKETLIGVFYMSTVGRKAKYSYEISCVSDIGLLDNVTHYGGIYTGQTMSDVLRDIIGGMVPYTLDSSLASIPVYGWLPIATRRDNLHQLLFAEGVSVKRSSNGDMYFTALTDSAPIYLPDDKMFLGGSIDFGSPATHISVTEHAYVAYSSDQQSTLFEGEAAAETITTPKGSTVSGVLVTFSGPMHNLSVSNGSILESGVNYAVLGASADCLLTGNAYTHTTRIIPRGQNVSTYALMDRKENEVSVTDATLVSLANSENVADRMYSYYGNFRKVQNDLVMGNERPGDAVTFNDPFDANVQGFIESMNITMSGILRAAGTMVTGFVPGQPGNFYSHYALITSDRTWTVPSDGKGKIRLVLIGGGQGGSNGHKGTDGGEGGADKFGDPGEGGAGGPGGKGGKIAVFTLQAAPGDTLTTAIGYAGSGAAAQDSGNVISGGNGGNTTVTINGQTYSSASGFSSDTGHVNVITGETYAFPGETGKSGGKAAEGDPESVDNYGTYSWSYNWTPYYNGRHWSNGMGGDSYYLWYNRPSNIICRMTGGLGGGGAIGTDGNNGRDGIIDFFSTDADGGVLDDRVLVDGGDGGAGATPTISGANSTNPGNGGGGGHGGGGGGGGAFVHGTISDNWGCEGGKGGIGGPGGSGAPGCVIVYY